MKKTKTKAAPRAPRLIVQHCNFSGVRWDAKAVDAVAGLVRAMEENARANAANAAGLGHVAEMLRAQHVYVDTMLKIDAKPGQFGTEERRDAP